MKRAYLYVRPCEKLLFLENQCKILYFTIIVVTVVIIVTVVTVVTVVTLVTLVTVKTVKENYEERKVVMTNSL